MEVLKDIQTFRAKGVDLVLRQVPGNIVVIDEQVHDDQDADHGQGQDRCIAAVSGLAPFKGIENGLGVESHKENHAEDGYADQDFGSQGELPCGNSEDQRRGCCDQSNDQAGWCVLLEFLKHLAPPF